MLIVSVLMTRFLSLELYGQYQLLLSYIGLLAIFGIPGLDTSIRRSVALGNDASYIKSIKAIFKWSFLAIPIISSLAIWHYFKGDFQFVNALIALALLFAPFQGFARWESLLGAKERFKKLAKLNMLKNISAAGIYCTIAYLFPNDIFAITLAYLSIYTLFNIVYFVLTLRYIKNKNEDKECLSFGYYLTFLGVMSIFVNQFDKILLGFLDIQMLAIYAIALKLLDAFNGLAKSFFTISFPKFVKMNVSINRRKIYFLAIVGIIISIILSLISKPLIHFLYTDKYDASIEIFIILVFILPISLVNLLLINKANAEKDKKRIAATRIYPPLISILSSVMIYVISEDIVYFVVCKVYTLQITYLIALMLRKRKANV